MIRENPMHTIACHMASTDSVKEHKLRKRVAWLSGKEGRGMEFVSLYIPYGKSPYEIVEMLRRESDSAEAKSERSRDRLQDALGNVIQHLRLKKEVPENGLAIFAGISVDDLGSEVSIAEEIVPPEPIPNLLYKVGDHFHLEPLREMLRKPRIVGVIAMDSKEASFGMLDGERLEFIESITSGIPGKIWKRRAKPKTIRKRT